MRLDAPRMLLAAGTVFTFGCGTGVAPSAQPADDTGSSAAMATSDRASHEDKGDARFHIVPRNAHVAGKTTLGWIPEFWRYLYSVPASQNPELVDGADCGVGQSGPVFFIPGEQHDVYTRACTIPAHTPVLWAIWAAFNDYPCPDPSFQPAPGQTLEDFLARGARAFDDAVTHLAATIDGRSIEVSRYRYTTGLVSFTGDPSLTTTFDGCVTGSQQVGVADGWYVLLRLPAGDHTLVVTATSPGGHATSQTFSLHVLGHDD
ncbi:MAG: hypothetical protein ACXWK5_00430 [Myxococcaceae bacterium]